MESMIIRIGLVLVGVVIMALSFWMNSYKKITVNFAVVWEILGVLLILIGIIPVFSEWTQWVSSGTGLAFFCVGIVFLFEEIRTSMLISQLVMKNQEMAMQISLLNQENEYVMNELERLGKAAEDSDEKDNLCNK